MDFAQVSFGNILLMVGLTLGVPLICGVLYEDAKEKLTIAKNSLRLYRERSRLIDAENEWKVFFRNLKEFDAGLDAVTERAISFRRNNYIRGFHIGGARNPEALQHLKLMSSRIA